MTSRAAGNDWILVANDDREALRNLGLALAAVGLRAQCVQRGGEALVLASLRTPALAVIDTRLADMRAEELARDLHALDAAIPVIVTDASGEPQVERAAREAGIVYFTNISGSVEELLPAILGTLAWSQRPGAAPAKWSLY